MPATTGAEPVAKRGGDAGIQFELPASDGLAAWPPDSGNAALMTRSTLMAMFGYGALAAVLLACLYLVSLFAAVVARIKKDGESLARTRILRPRVRLAGHSGQDLAVLRPAARSDA